MPRTKSKMNLEGPTIHELLTKSEVPILEPLVIRKAHKHGISDIAFCDGMFITVDKLGTIFTWKLEWNDSGWKIDVRNEDLNDSD